MATSRAWLPREGFTADVVGRIIRNTALNPAITLPLVLLAQYTRSGRELSAAHETALKRLKLLLYIGIVRLVNRYLSRRALNNWQTAQYDWNKEVAVVTGGSGGIGMHISFLLAEQGVKVASLDVQPPTFETRPNITHFTCDVTSAESISDVATTIRSTFGSPTILVNNAGVASGMTILKSTDAAIERTFAVNIIAHFRLVREFLPSMVAADHGTVVTIASMAAAVSTAKIVDYCCSKSAALAFHEGLSAELVTHYNAPKVRTICVCPSFVETSMTKGMELADKFLIPMQKVETVTELVVQKIFSGDSGVLTIPDAAGWLGWPIRAMPQWLQVRLRIRAGQPLKDPEELKEIEKLVEHAKSRDGS